MKQSTYQSIVYKEGKFYVAQCLNVDISSFGASSKEALSNLQEALELYLEDAPTTNAIHEVEQPSIHSLHLQHA